MLGSTHVEKDAMKDSHRFDRDQSEEIRQCSQTAEQKALSRVRDPLGEANNYETLQKKEHLPRVVVLTKWDIDVCEKRALLCTRRGRRRVEREHNPCTARSITPCDTRGAERR